MLDSSLRKECFYEENRNVNSPAGYLFRLSRVSLSFYALELVLHDEEYLLYITKRLYPDIAKHFHTTSAKVERSIRTAITICWNEGNKNLLIKIAGYPLTRKPTTGEFISILSFYLRLKE